jgi:GNAT superfamily N-acetyltransferase
MRWMFDHHPVEAEVALTVEKPYRDQGIGSALLGRIIKAARNRHVRRLHMICLAENVPMQQVARKHRARLSFEEGAIVGELDPPYPSPFTLWLEGLDEGSGYVAAMIDTRP